MFFQGIIEFLIFIGFCYLVYRWIIKPILESKGIKVEDDPIIETNYTKRLEKIAKEFEEKAASVKAIRKEEDLTKDIKDINEEIKRRNGNIENINKE